MRRPGVTDIELLRGDRLTGLSGGIERETYARAKSTLAVVVAPPITRAYADLDDILGQIPAYAGRGSVTPGTAERGHEGTTFELSCHTDPVGHRTRHRRTRCASL